MSSQASPPELIHRLLDATRSGQSVAVATVVATRGETALRVGAKLLVYASGAAFGDFGNEAEGLAEAVAADALRLMRAGRLEVLTYELAPRAAHLGPASVDVAVEPFLPEPSVLILGAGHIAIHLARLCDMLGYEVTVVDERPEYASRDRFPRAQTVLAEDFDTALGRFQVTPASFVVLVTRGHKLDYQCLRQLIWSNPAYIGMIGSRRRVRAALQALIQEGVPADRLRRVHAPIGLDIAADSPEEIAVAIAAEIIKVRRGGAAASLSDTVDVEQLTTTEQLPTWSGRP